jgi:uncharacterized phage protein (predicted DNA packaging)
MILDDVKMALRITHNALDTEVIDLIASARNDLVLAGILPIKANDDADPLIKRAIVAYAKSQFGYDNPEADRFQRAYDSLKLRLAIAPEYVGESSETP